MLVLWINKQIFQKNVHSKKRGTKIKPKKLIKWGDPCINVHDKK